MHLTTAAAAVRVGRHWIKQVFLGVFMLPLVISVVAGGVQVLSVAYHSARTLHFSSVLAIGAIILLLALPLNLIGCIFGRNLAGANFVPCRVNAVPRPIPDKKWSLLSPSPLPLHLLHCLPFFTLPLHSPTFSIPLNSHSFFLYRLRFSSFLPILLLVIYR